MHLTGRANALAENMWSVIKTECVRRSGPFPTRDDAEIALFQYIDAFYNPTRIQERLGWKSPEEFEAAYWNTETQAPAAATVPTPTRPASRRQTGEPEPPPPPPPPPPPTNRVNHTQSLAPLTSTVDPSS